MKYAVPAEIIAAASACSRDHACLGDSDHRCCLVIETIGTEVHFIDPDSSLICDYRLCFAGGWICTCPVRKHLRLMHSD